MRKQPSATFLSCDLDLDPMTFIDPWRYTGSANMNFLC